MASGLGGSGLSTEIKESLLASYTQGLAGHGDLSAGQGQPPAHAQYWPQPDSTTPPETPPWWSQQTWGWPQVSPGVTNQNSEFKVLSNQSLGPVSYK